MTRQVTQNSHAIHVHVDLTPIEEWSSMYAKYKSLRD